MFERARGAKAGAAVVDPVAVLIPQLQKNHTQMKQEEREKKCNKQIFSLSYWADICNLTAAKNLGLRLLPGGIWYNSELQIKTWTEERMEGWTTDLRAAGSAGKWWGDLGCGACKWRRQVKKHASHSGDGFHSGKFHARFPWRACVRAPLSGRKKWQIC